MSESVRAFMAIDVNNDEVRRRLSEAQGILVSAGAELKLVKALNFHLTIRFLGNIRTNIVDSVYEEMKRVALAPFDVVMRGIGVFPNLKYPRVFWAGIHEGAEELRELSQQLEPGLRRLGFPPDKKGFSPHLTIARVKRRIRHGKIIERMKELGDYEFGTFRADHLKLKRSTLTPKGPTYTTLREIIYH